MVFASALSETLMEITQYHKEPPSGPVYDYRYGWCFFTAGAAFIMTKMAAVFSLTGYLNRFPSVDEMVRFIPFHVYVSAAVSLPRSRRYHSPARNNNKFLLRTDLITLNTFLKSRGFIKFILRRLKRGICLKSILDYLRG